MTERCGVGVLPCREMHPSLRMIARLVTALAPLLCSACFDFDATMAGGPLVDSGPGSGLDASVNDGSLPPPTPFDGGDSGTITDAGADAPTGADDAGPFCPTTPPDAGLFFCADFDEYPYLGSFQVFDELAGSMVDTDASSRSPPNSVDETTTALSQGQPINVALRTPLAVPTVPATLTFAFSVEPVRIDSAANAAIVLGAVDFIDNAGNRYTAGLAINVFNGLPALALGEQSGLVDGATFPDGALPVFTNHPLSPTNPMPMNQWTDLVLELDWSATSLEGKVFVNGVQGLDVPLSLTVQPTSLQIGIGTSFVTEYAGGTSPIWELRYDNVLFTGH